MPLLRHICCTSAEIENAMRLLATLMHEALERQALIARDLTFTGISSAEKPADKSSLHDWNVRASLEPHQAE